MNKWLLASGALVLFVTGCAVQTGGPDEPSTGSTSTADSEGRAGMGVAESQSQSHVPLTVSNKGPGGIPDLGSHRVGTIHIVPLTPDPPPPNTGHVGGSGASGEDEDDGEGRTHAHIHATTIAPFNGTQRIHIVPLTPDPPPPNTDVAE